LEDEYQHFKQNLGEKIGRIDAALRDLGEELP